MVDVEIILNGQNPGSLPFGSSPRKPSQAVSVCYRMSENYFHNNFIYRRARIESDRLA